MTKQEVTQTLKDSGLFEKFAIYDTYEGRDRNDFWVKTRIKKIYLTTNQAEGIFSNMIRYNAVSIIIFIGSHIEITGGNCGEGKHHIVLINDGFRFALNELIAWCCNNMKPELERAMKEIL